jgi:hypothetical protein
VQITIDQWQGSRFHVTEQEATYIRTQDFVPGQIGEAARALARKLNQDLFANYTGVYGYVGTAATNPFASTINTLADAKNELDFQLAPDGNRKLLIGLEEEAAALKLVDFIRMLNAGDSKAFRQGDLGNLFGMMIRRDRDRPTHTAGVPGGTPLVVGAHSAGDTTIDIDGMTATTGTYKKGDVVLFDGDTHAYAIQADVTASGAGAVTVTVSPPLRVALADNATVTLKATHKVNLACDPAAFGLVMRMPPTSIEGAPTYGASMGMVDPQTGIPLRLTYLPGYHAAAWELSIMYGTKLVDGRRAVRVAG